MKKIMLLALMVLGCQPAKDLNRVQENYTDKSLFDGEWYYRASFVDKQYNEAGAVIGSECNLDRVRFDVGEKMLRAFRSYERVGGTEGANPGHQTLVAAFPIVEHFDIVRDYNPQTGVQNNNIVENKVDRSWDKRKYVRVDWSKNLAPDVGCNDWIQSMAMIQVPRNSAGSPREPYRVRVSKDYVETTIEALAQPNQNACNYISEWNCTPSRVRMKFSFRKIEPSAYEKMLYPDYKTVEYGKTAAGEICTRGTEGCTDLKELWLSNGPAGTEVCNPAHHNIDDCVQYEVPVFSRFGYFRTERHQFDRENGFTLSGREQYINRWNIWQQTTSADGSVIPMSQRIPKTIVYYLNPQFPTDLYEASQLLAQNWNVAFSDAVAAVKSNCTLSEYNRYVATQKLKKDMTALGYAVATEANLSQACVALGNLSINKGLKPIFLSGHHDQVNKLYGNLFEIRRNDCNPDNIKAFADKYQLNEDLESSGISTVTTGNLEEACAVLEMASIKKKLDKRFEWQQLGDLRYSFLNYAPKAELAGPLGLGPSAADPLTGEIISGNANIYGANIDTYASFGADIVQALNGELSDTDIMNGTHIREHVARTKEEFEKKVAREDVYRFGRLFDERTSHMRNKDYYTERPRHVVDENWSLLKSSGIDAQYLVDESMIRPDIASLADKRAQFFSERNACFLSEMVEPAVADLATHLKGKTRMEAYQMIRANVFLAVGLHEIGHTFGLRHNFSASNDALNFFPEFWGVDTHDHRMSKLTSRQSEMKYASIMDYHQRFNSDFAGIGLYDRAAIKFGYTSLIEVWDQTNDKFVPEDWVDNIDMFHYSDLPYLFAGDEANNKISRHYDVIRSRYRGGDDTAVVDVKNIAISPNPANLFKRKYVPFDEYHQQLLYRFLGDSKKESLYEVPYKYCSDIYASGVNMTCNRWDMGASAEEIVSNAAELYESYYPFYSFRGDKINFSPQDYMSRLYGRTYQPMLNAFRYLYYYRRSSLRMWPVMQDWTAAAYKGINFFGRVLQSVEPGSYCLTGNKYVLEKPDSDCQSRIEIGMDQGRYYNTTFTPNVFFKINNVGHMYDKLLALQALTDSAAFFTRDFSASFSRGAFSIGYYRVFAPELTSLFASLAQGDVDSYSPEIVLEDGKPVIKYRPLVMLANAETTSVSPRIQASESWMMRYYGIIFPMLRYTSTIDKQLDFAKRARVTLVGSKHDPKVNLVVPQIVFTDPVTKLQYRSLAPEGEKLAPGYQLLQEAQRFVDGPLTDAKNAVNNAKTDQETHRAETNLKAKMHELNERIRMIDLVRYLGDLLDYGA